MKLLLIDKERSQSDWIRRRLESEKNQVIITPDWPTGWALIRQTHIDVVLLTIRLSETDTVDLASPWPTEIPGIPLFLIISPDTSANKSWALESGAADCVGDAVDGRELNARLYALHRRRAGYLTASSTVRLADLVVNVITRTIYRGNTRIDLLPREYDLLLFLVENQGRVVSKKEIIEKAWSTATPPKSNTVDVYINYLRNKIDRQSSVKLIHTVPGLGYIVRISTNSVCSR